MDAANASRARTAIATVLGFVQLDVFAAEAAKRRDVRERDFLAAASLVEHDNRDAAPGDESNAGKGQSVRQLAPDDQARNHAPQRKAVKEGRNRGGPAEPIGEQQPGMPQGKEQTSEAEKRKMATSWSRPGLYTERHRPRPHHHHEHGRKDHYCHRNAGGHATPDEITRRAQ